MVGARRRLSAARQALGLETSPAQRAAAAKPAKEQPWVDEFNYDAHQLDPVKDAAMVQSASDYHYAQDAMQAPAESPQMSGQAPAPPANTPAAPASSAAVPKPNPSMDAAMAPIASYFKENGRMPNTTELQTHMMKSQARAQLGREPTPEELSLFVAKPATK